MTNIINIDGKLFSNTHLVLTDRGLIKAENLKVGDTIIDMDGSESKIKNIIKPTSKISKEISKSRVDSYITICKIKYKDLSADEIIDIIENGNEVLRFNSEYEKNLFKKRWENVK